MTSVMSEHFNTLELLPRFESNAYRSGNDCASGSVYRARDEESQPLAVVGVEWRTMKNRRDFRAHRTIITARRRRQRNEDTLRLATLGSPIFVESWHHGSPLNWVEFMGSWHARRIDQPPKKTED